MKNKQKHIFIIGMMCSGKSRVASLLSKKLNIPFIDTDRVLKELKLIFDSGWIGLGPKTKEFENKLSQYNLT